jgi:Methylase involved in ubiquinone/menaquinone biosynthesis
MKLSIDESTEVCRLLADASRQRLLLLIEYQPLSVAELTEVTGLAQSRVSTHLARLVRAGLVTSQRGGGAALYQPAADDGNAAELWSSMRARLSDPQARLDRERADQVIRARKGRQSWAESVAGRMDLHYSPGRTWEATSHALIGLLQFGRVLDLASGDGVLAELLAPRADGVLCVDISSKVLAAARRRLQRHQHVDFLQADMHALPLADHGFDHVFLMHALAYSREPAALMSEAARQLAPRGRMVVAALASHRHRATMEAYDHVNLGFTPQAIHKLMTDQGLVVEECGISSREPRPPYFEVITAWARRPEA